MPLRSTTLSINAALQACLEKDAAHILRGAQGPHVGLIHKCLLILEGSPIDGNEIRMRTYGPTTAAAVLAYKRARQIINRTYQNQADDIVGKMTIARLDDDMVKVEQSRTFLVRCAGSGAGRVATAFGVTAGSEEGLVTAPVQHRRLLTIHLQRTDSAQLVDVFTNDLLARANELLRRHGLQLEHAPLMSGSPIPWPDGVVHTQFPVDRFALRKSALASAPGADNVLRIILCPFDPIDPIHGITDGGRLQNVQELVPKFILINTVNTNPDRGTLLHEMIHAAFPAESPVHEEQDPRSVYSTSTARNRLSDDHARRLAGAFFARSVR